MRLATLLALAAVLASAGENDELLSHSMAFERHWNRYIRRLAGCPDQGEVSRQICIATPHIDYAEFGAARKEAMRLFDLREK